jgi:BMFP domain-containing protein YqiC
MAAPGSGGRVLLDALEELLAELPGRVRGGTDRVSGQALGALRALVAELELVTRDEYEALELRVAQLEHRLRLLEAPRDGLEPPAPQGSSRR